MSRRKRQNQMLNTARQYVDLYMPELRGASLRVRSLDGPPGSPRYAVIAEVCPLTQCPHGIAPAISASGQCPVRECPLRRSARLLLDRNGVVMRVTRSAVHWN